MTSDDKLTLVSSIVFLALAALAASRARRDPLAMPLGALYIALFGYDATELIGTTNAPAARWLNAAIAGLAVPLTFNVVVTFVGERRRAAWVLRVLTAYFALLGLVCMSPFVVPRWATFPLSAAWASAFALGMAPAIGMATFLLVRHLRASREDERARAWIVLVALVLGIAGGGGTDVLALSGLPVPRLAVWGLLAGALVLAAGTLRFKLTRDLTPRALASSFAIAVAGVIAQLALLRWGGGSAAMLLAGSVVVTVAVWGGLRQVTGKYAEQTARLRYHATLGRFAAQMAHDVRNPLAAVRGGAEFLLEEHANGRPLEEHTRYLRLIVEQTDRITRVVEQYQRLGRAEAARVRVDLNALVREVVGAQRVALGPQTTLVEELDPDLPMLDADTELLSGALENLLRNAHEAMPDGGKVTVRTARSGGRVVLAVDDEGRGMDATTRENALDDFFTTKATGSGLGLAFVRRVAEAHDGGVRITSSVGHGTTVYLELPPGVAASPGGDLG